MYAFGIFMAKSIMKEGYQCFLLYYISYYTLIMCMLCPSLNRKLSLLGNYCLSDLSTRVNHFLQTIGSSLKVCLVTQETSNISIK